MKCNLIRHKLEVYATNKETFSIRNGINYTDDIFGGRILCQTVWGGALQLCQLHRFQSGRFFYRTRVLPSGWYRTFARPLLTYPSLHLCLAEASDPLARSRRAGP